MRTPKSHRGHSCSRGLSLALAWFIRVGVGSLERGRSVEWSSRGFNTARQGVAGLIRVRVGSLRHAKVSSCSLGFAWVNSGAQSGRQLHSGSRGLTLAHLGDVGFILVPVGAPRPCRVHSCSRGCYRARLIGFIQVRVGSLGYTLWSSRSFNFSWDRSGADRHRLVHSGSHGFTRTRLVVVGCI